MTSWIYKRTRVEAYISPVGQQQSCDTPPALTRLTFVFPFHPANFPLYIAHHGGPQLDQRPREGGL